MKARIVDFLIRATIALGLALSAGLVFVAAWCVVKVLTAAVAFVVALVLALAFPVVIAFSLPPGARLAKSAIPFQPGVPAAPGFFWSVWRRA